MTGVKPDEKLETLAKAAGRDVPIDRVASEPIGTNEKEAVNMRLRRSTDVFDLDLVKRREQKLRASVSMMELKNRDRIRKAFLNVFLFPFHLSWWRKRVPSSRSYLWRLSVLYFLHGASVIREFVRRPSETPVEFVELMLPFLLLIVLSVLMGQAAAATVAPQRLSDADSARQEMVSSNGKPAADAQSALKGKVSVSMDEPKTSSVTFQGKPRKMRRKPSKSESTMTAGTDSCHEMYNDDDEERTASSDSEESDTSSDSSSGDSKKPHHRPQVAVRRSSLLGLPGTGSHAGALISKGSQEFTSSSARSPTHGGLPQQQQQHSSITETLKKPQSRDALSPNQAVTRSTPNGRKPRFWPSSRLNRHHTDPTTPLKETLESSIHDVESVSEEGSDEEEEDSKQGEDGDGGRKLNRSLMSTNSEGANDSLLRNRFFSHSMEDLLDTVKSVHWSAHGPEKVLLTPGQIRAELERKVFEVRMSESYRQFAFAGAVLVSLLPIAFRVYLFGTAFYCTLMKLEPLQIAFDVPSQCESETGTTPPVGTLGEEARVLFTRVIGTSMLDAMGVVTSAMANFALSWITLGHVAGAVETFKRRHLYAKYFAKLTSSRKARRAGLPYFRLHKVDHIKAWLSLRSRRADLDREAIGPYQASDTVTHHLFMAAIFLVGVVAFRAVQHLSNSNGKHQQNSTGLVPSTLGDWLLVAWAFILAVFVQRIMDLASKTHEKFQNTSVLLTEELNIHMRLLRKPEKKDELTACNQMLKVAGALIKELEGNKSKKGQNGALVLDPWLYSIVRVVLLSALGALSSDLFGFRVRLWKI